jgi:lysophospholipase L1-like esterase
VARIGAGKRIVFASLPLLALAGMAELFLRVTHLAESCPNRFSDSQVWVCDPILHFKVNRELRPTGQPLNSEGFRGDEWRPKPPGVYRILALGDSCTFGYIARENIGFVKQPYPLKLQRLIERRVGRDRVEVLNAGVPGYNSFHGVLLLRTRLRDLDPDLVTVRYGWNDLFLSADGEGEALFREPESALGLFLEDLALRTRLYPFARRLAMELRALRRPVADQARSAFALQRSWEPTISIERYEHNLRRIVEIGRSRGAEVWLLTSPANPAPGEEAAKEIGVRNRLAFDEILRIHDEYNEAVRRVGRQMDALVVDMAAVYARHPGTPLFFPTDIPHPTEGGHVLEAETLYTALVKRGVIRPSEPAPGAS